MNDDAAREKLAALLMALWEEDAGESLDGVDGVSESIDAYLDRLLPVVREIAAEELRRAYVEDRTTVAKMTPIERLTCFVVKMEDLVVRADALTRPPDGPVR